MPHLLVELVGLETFYLGWIPTAILLISTSQVATTPGKYTFFAIKLISNKSSVL
jgi:hypothetical protein